MLFVLTTSSMHPQLDGTMSSGIMFAFLGSVVHINTSLQCSSVTIASVLHTQAHISIIKNFACISVKPINAFITVGSSGVINAANTSPSFQITVISAGCSMFVAIAFCKKIKNGIQYDMQILRQNLFIQILYIPVHLHVPVPMCLYWIHVNYNITVLYMHKVD